MLVCTAHTSFATAGVLTLTIDRDSRRAWIENLSDSTVRTNGYHILSSAGLLNPAGWFSFQDLTRQDQRAANALLGSLTWLELQQTASSIVEYNEPGETLALPGFRVSLGQPLAAYLANDIRFVYQDLDLPGLTKSTDGLIKIRGEILFPWQNPANSLDVNNNGTVEPLDALLLINSINDDGSRMLPVPPVAPDLPPPYLDPSGDNHLSAIDALMVIDAINGRVASASVPEPTTRTLTFASLPVIMVIIAAVTRRNSGRLRRLAVVSNQLC